MERLTSCAAKTLTGILLALFPDVLERLFFFQCVAYIECTKCNKEKVGSLVKVCRKRNQFVDVLWCILAVTVTFPFKFVPQVPQHTNFLSSLQSSDYDESIGESAFCLMLSFSSYGTRNIGTPSLSSKSSQDQVSRFCHFAGHGAEMEQ